MSLDTADKAVLERTGSFLENPRMTDVAFKSSFLKLLQDRGYIHQITHPEELDDAAANGVVTAYVGYDATAPSLHIGNLISIMMLRRLQQTGHKPIVIVGGGTTKVGDPSGKDETRKLLTHEDIQRNIATQKQAFAKLLTFGDGPTDAMLVDNDEWLSKLGYIDCQYLAPRIKAEVLMFTGLMDTICPPSSQYAAYNRITSKKDVVLYPDYGHEGLPGESDRTFNFMLGL